MIGALLVLSSALAAPVSATPKGPVVDGPAVDCPSPRLGTPRYPVDLARANKQGTVLVGARVDECGRVLETRVDESSGHKAFDESALAAVSTFVLDAVQRSKAKDGWVQLPIKFGGFRTVTEIRKIPWPRSHRRPRYLPDGAVFPFERIADFEAAKVRDTTHVMESPYASVRDTEGRRYTTTLLPDRGDPSVFWFTYTMHPKRPASPSEPFGPPETAAVARYRLVEEDGEPVVRLGLLCERPAKECEKLRAFLFEGLSFAKARRR